MATNYTVVWGDTLTKIATKHGFSDWRIIYNHPSNAAFKAKRPNPDKIFVGDVLVIPDNPASPVPPASPAPPSPSSAPPKRLPDLPFFVKGQRFLIGQPTFQTCWAACMAMFKSWKAGKKLEIKDVLKPSVKHLAMFELSRGLPTKELGSFGTTFGLKPEPEDPEVVKALVNAVKIKPFDPATLATSMFSPAVFLSLMQDHGLLIVASFTSDGGTLNLGGHVRVMYGMEGSLTDVANCRVHLLDPFNGFNDKGRDIRIGFNQFIFEYFTMFFTFHRERGTEELVQIIHA
jgi:hypothetical protein